MTPWTPSLPALPWQRAAAWASVEGDAVLKHFGLENPDACLGFEGAFLVREAEDRRTFRLSHKGADWYLKIHRGTPSAFPGRLPSAMNEARNLERLQKGGFPIPGLAAAARWGKWPAQGSMVLMRGLNGMDWRALLSTPPASAEIRDSQLRRLALLVKRFHEAGYFHRDLYLMHLWQVHKDGEDPWSGTPHFIDLHRLGQGLAGNSQLPQRRRWKIKDLAALHASCPESVTREEKRNFLRVYLGPEGGERALNNWSAQITRKSERLLRHTPKYP